MKRIRPSLPFALLGLTLVLVANFVGCSLTKHFRSSRNVLLRRPPYYMGKQRKVEPPIGVFPVELDRRLQRDMLRKEVAERLREFVDRVNRYLTTQANADLVVLPAIERPIEDAPDVYVGNPLGDDSPDAIEFEEEIKNDELAPGEHVTLVYALAPAFGWKQRLRQLGYEYGLQHVVFITLGVSEYFPTQINWKGSKAIYLGTGHAMRLKWLTSLDDPIEVLHFAGALMDTTGKILRAGAEGFHAKPGSFLESVFGLRRTHGEDDIDEILQMRREDLSDRPLVWQVAVQNLLIQLTGGRRPIVP